MNRIELIYDSLGAVAMVYPIHAIMLARVPTIKSMVISMANTPHSVASNM